MAELMVKYSETEGFLEGLSRNSLEPIHTVALFLTY
jgi:hypothetical protein